jgi:acyl-coenzyme A synthetase/AMP-(fatty) acid ligase
MNLVDMIFFHAAADAERPAFVTMPHVITYRMLADGVAAAEARIAAAGVGPRDVVGIVLGNPIHHATLILALQRLGVVSVSFPSHAAAAKPRLGMTAILVEETKPVKAPFRQIAVGPDWFREPPAAPAARHAFAEDEACRIFLSSGTTGQPRPVWLTPSAIASRMVAHTLTMAAGSWERMLCTLGLGSAWGFCAIMAALWGGKTVCHARTPDEALRMIALFRADLLIASIHQLRTMLEIHRRSPHHCATLRQINTGGSTFPRELVWEAQQKLCSRVVLIYGSTETGTSAFALANRLGSVEGATGLVAPWARIEAVDAEQAPLPPGTEGVLRVRTPNHGRWHESEHDKGEPRDWEWFYPGDQGFVGADGLVVITGRASEIINVGGVKLSPERIERALLSHPLVRDAAVAGLPGAGGIEEIRAAIVPWRAIEEKALIAWCAERMPNTPPRHLRIVESIPRNENGKILRQQVRDMLAD